MGLIYRAQYNFWASPLPLIFPFVGHLCIHYIKNPIWLKERERGDTGKGKPTFFLNFNLFPKLGLGGGKKTRGTKTGNIWARGARNWKGAFGLRDKRARVFTNHTGKGGRTRNWAQPQINFPFNLFFLKGHQFSPGKGPLGNFFNPGI